MAMHRFNPLDCIPSPEVVRQKLRETEAIAERLRILLEVSERINADREAAESRREVPRD